LYGEGLLPALAERHFQTVKNRFTAAFGRALPRLNEQELAVRFQFMVGAMAHTMLFSCRHLSVDRNLLERQLTAFLVGGLCAPAGTSENTEETK
jgi:hypothetical protein